MDYQMIDYCSTSQVSAAVKDYSLLTSSAKVREASNNIIKTEVKTSVDAGNSQPPATDDQTPSQFSTAVLQLQGLVDLLKQPFIDEDKMGLLAAANAAYSIEDEKSSLVSEILSFISKYLFNASQLEKELLLYIVKAFTLIVEMMNQNIPHPFMENSQKACEEFLQTLLHHSPSSSEGGQTISQITRCISKNYSLGSFFISLVLEEFHKTGEILLENMFDSNDHVNGIRKKFASYQNLLLTILPIFGRTVCELFGTDSTSSKSKDALVIPRISLGEIRNFNLRLIHWKELLESTELGFSLASSNSKLAADVMKLKKIVIKITEKVFKKK